MPIENPLMNIVRFKSVDSQYVAVIGDESKLLSDQVCLQAMCWTREDALAGLAVEMSKKGWKCEPWGLPYRECKNNLSEGNVIIEYKGSDDGWVVQHWVDGKEEGLVGAAHISHPEAALAVLALMIANPKRYQEGDEDHPKQEETEKKKEIGLYSKIDFTVKLKHRDDLYFTGIVNKVEEISPTEYQLSVDPKGVSFNQVDEISLTVSQD